MDPRAKQRLTGAIILVALFVLLVPELLTGPKSAVGPATPDEVEGLRRYTIDLSAPSPGSAPAAQAEVALPPVAGMSAPADRAVPGEAAIAETAAPQIAAPEVATPEAAIPEPRPDVVQERAAASSVAPATKPPTAPASGTFVVQLGSFRSRDNAERLVRDMTAKGFATFIAPITTNGRELYRVRVGPTRDRAAAEALASQLKRQGQSGSIVPIS